MFRSALLWAVCAAAVVWALGAPAPARATICADGTYSSSTGPGTCSHHGGIAGGGGGSATGDMDCADFATQGTAQAYFTALGGSPTNNVDNLDADHDGIACEDNPQGPVGAAPPAACPALAVAGPADGAVLPYASRVSLSAQGVAASDFMTLTIAPVAEGAAAPPSVSIVDSVVFATLHPGADGATFAWTSNPATNDAAFGNLTPGRFAWQIEDLSASPFCLRDSAVQTFTVAPPAICPTSARLDGVMVQLSFCPATKTVSIALARSRLGGALRSRTVSVVPGRPATIRMHTARRARWARVTYEDSSYDDHLLGAAPIRRG